MAELVLFSSWASKQGVWHMPEVPCTSADRNKPGGGAWGDTTLLAPFSKTQPRMPSNPFSSGLFISISLSSSLERRVPLAYTLLFCRDEVCLPARAVTPAFLPAACSRLPGTDQWLPLFVLLKSCLIFSMQPVTLFFPFFFLLFLKCCSAHGVALICHSEWALLAWPLSLLSSG